MNKKGRKEEKGEGKKKEEKEEEGGLTEEKEREKKISCIWEQLLQFINYNKTVIIINKCVIIRSELYEHLPDYLVIPEFSGSAIF